MNGFDVHLSFFHVIICVDQITAVLDLGYLYGTVIDRFVRINNCNKRTFGNLVSHFNKAVIAGFAFSDLSNSNYIVL